MRKISDRIPEVVEPYLQSDEELCAVGQLTSGPISLMQAYLLAGVGVVLLVRVWWVGITQRRVVFVRLTRYLQRPETNPEKCVWFATPLSNVRVENWRLLVITPEGEVPQTFRFHFGAKRATGLDRAEFAKVVSNPGDTSLSRI